METISTFTCTIIFYYNSRYTVCKWNILVGFFKFGLFPNFAFLLLSIVGYAGISWALEAFCGQGKSTFEVSSGTEACPVSSSGHMTLFCYKHVF